MTTALDTNILVALWGPDTSLNIPVRNALYTAQSGGPVVLAPPVFAELLAARDAEFVDRFLEETQLIVEWELTERVWRAAGQAFRSHAARRKTRRDIGPRRILADFVIGAHAYVNQYSLLTLDDHFFRLAFPGLRVVAI